MGQGLEAAQDPMPNRSGKNGSDVDLGSGPPLGGQDPLWGPSPAGALASYTGQISLGQSQCQGSGQYNYLAQHSRQAIVRNMDNR